MLNYDYYNLKLNIYSLNYLSILKRFNFKSILKVLKGGRKNLLKKRLKFNS